MADEVDLIEESNDEIENWIYYSNECKPQENTDEQQLIYIDPSDLVVKDEVESFQYDCDDSNIIINEGHDQDRQGNNNQTEENVQQLEENNEDTSKHSLILRETIDENGHLVEGYFCQQCNLAFDGIEDFLSYHPCVELVNENFENKEEKKEVTPILGEEKLWDVVENLEATENDDDGNINDVEIKPNLAESNIDLDEERYFCYDCQKVFKDFKTAENHDCVDELQNTNDCIESDKTLLVDNADGNVYKCHLCGKDYISLRSFSNHQRWHKKNTNNLVHTKIVQDEPTVCKICNTIFASEKNLKLHMKMHKKQAVKTIQDALPVGAQDEYNELSQFFCEICNKSFDQKLLTIHKNMHQNLEEYICGKCNKQFENLPSYEIHMQIHFDIGVNSRKANMAKKTNETDSGNETPSTSNQSSIDDGKRKFACQYCGKGFLRPYEKVKHERIHTGEKPYECEVCGKTFRVSYSLTLHLRTHTDIRPYVCATCNKRFKQKSVYVHHLKTHFVERGYKCDICGKSFRTSVQLSGHKNVHSKPYNCIECNRPFASLYAVKIHMKTHNKGHKSNRNLKNSCSICGASYSRLFALRLHIKEQHGIDVDTGKLIEDTNTNENTPKEFYSETSNPQMHFININDEEDYDDDGVNNEDSMFNNQVDHGKNIENSLPNNVYLDENDAAAQTILMTEEISVDHIPAEEIVTDWLVK